MTLRELILAEIEEFRKEDLKIEDDQWRLFFLRRIDGISNPETKGYWIENHDFSDYSDDDLFAAFKIMMFRGSQPRG